MPWDDTARAEHKRETDRYPSDLTDAEWDIIGPLLPPAKTGGRPRKTKLREIMNAILYMATSGCQWRMLPTDFPPRSTVQGYFYDWTYTGLLDTINVSIRGRPQGGLGVILFGEQLPGVSELVGCWLMRPYRGPVPWPSSTGGVRGAGSAAYRRSVRAHLPAMPVGQRR